MYGFPTPLNPSGNTPTTSPARSSRSASALQASVDPVLRANSETTGVEKTRFAPSSRSGRRAGCSSSSASEVINESTAIVPEWFATTRAPPVAGTLSMPRVSTRNQRRYSGRSAASSTLSDSSGSKPNSSTW